MDEAEEELETVSKDIVFIYIQLATEISAGNSFLGVGRTNTYVLG